MLVVTPSFLILIFCAWLLESLLRFYISIHTEKDPEEYV